MDNKKVIEEEMNKLVLLIDKVKINLYPNKRLEYEKILFNLNNLIKNL